MPDIPTAVRNVIGRLSAPEDQGGGATPSSCRWCAGKLRELAEVAKTDVADLCDDLADQYDALANEFAEYARNWHKRVLAVEHDAESDKPTPPIVPTNTSAEAVA